MASKSKTIKNHARRRFGQRHGMALTNELHQILVRKIQHGKAVMSIAQSCNRTLHRLEHDDCVFDVIYDRDRKLIVTVLPRGE